ncbi:hypothetical protein [Candidatus Methylocalor cossyra]|uniref:Cytochrome c-type biogenesis protein DsbD, protein-disulfide reductase n=1 Tax=Candidatus Methylocalor cossyra TaxID=3108543 RepID=A0ABP1C7Z7_9GAMM
MIRNIFAAGLLAASATAFAAEQNQEPVALSATEMDTVTAAGGGLLGIIGGVGDLVSINPIINAGISVGVLGSSSGGNAIISVGSASGN